MGHQRTDTQRVALCLSGGGFRAAVFHASALKRLNELQIFCRATAVCSVSGGSVINGSLSTRWPLLTVAYAVAASPAYPVAFSKLRLTFEPPQQFRGGHGRPDEVQRVETVTLTDGGEYDNLGLEPVCEAYPFLLVSDGGHPLASAKERSARWSTTGTHSVSVGNFPAAGADPGLSLAIR